MRRARGSTLTVALLAVLLAGSAVLVVALGRQKATLTERNRLLIGRLTQAHPGFIVPERPVETLAGEPVVLGRATPGERQLLFFFTTTCDTASRPCPPGRRWRPKPTAPMASTWSAWVSTRRTS